MPGLSRCMAPVIGMGVLLYPVLAQAQVRPDRTTNTVRLGNCAVQCDIQGGIESDRNLFHSFKTFSIPDTGAVYFRFPNRIRNLFVRVTGQRTSNIEGLLYADGFANVFFMNPNGILFSENAAINVGGSFTATTADAIAFDELGTFNARPRQSTDPQLLSIDPSAFLFQTVPAPIDVTTNGLNPLQVLGNTTLLFLGGDIQVDYSALYAPGGGSVQLVSIGEPGEILFSPNPQLFDLSIPPDLERADITLRDSTLDVRAFEQGEMFLFGDNISISNSALLGGIGLDSGFTGAIAGDLVFSATDSITVDTGSVIGNNIYTGAIGNSGDITFTANAISVLDGSQIDTSTFGQGNAGSVIIEAGDRVLIQGTLPERALSSAILSTANQGAIGNGGDISIRANELLVLDGAQLSTATDTQGNAGNIRIEASDRVVFDGFSEDRQYASIAFSNVEYFGVGDGGSIRIDTGDLQVTNGASLVASTDGIGDAGRIVIRVDDTAIFAGTAQLQQDGLVNSGIFNRVEPFGIGDAGNIRIIADTINIEDGARITSTSLNTGNAGNVVLRARDSIVVDRALVQTDTGPGVLGAGGDIAVFTDSLMLRNAQLLAASEGVNQAGNIFIDAHDIRIDGGGVITATLSQNGGDITIADADLLLLRNNALLTTQAGLDQDNGGGNGGNIAIASDLIVAVPVEDSNISADAFDGNGGNVDIITQGLFGIEFREFSTPLSDITASSEFGIDGEVTITNPAIDPTSGLFELPDEFVDASTQLRQDCKPQSVSDSPQNRSEFIVTGRGGCLLHLMRWGDRRPSKRPGFRFPQLPFPVPKQITRTR